jgi:hypothetical protein
MDANRHPDTNVYFLECLIVSTDDTATAGNGDFGTSPFLGGLRQATNLLVKTVVGASGAKAQEQIKKLGTDLFTCRLGAFPR